MEPKQDTMTIKDILDLYKHEMLKPNPEYQRGAVWSKQQKQKLVDSVLRGYPIPLIYLHDIQREIAGRPNNILHIIDGQQRIRALYEFAEGGFPLLNPEEDNALFPQFLKEQPCAWAEQKYDALSDKLKQEFLDTKLPIVKMESASDHEVRDLFIRLQAGSALNPQEKRDATVGNFASLVLEIGGKPDMGPRYNGHEFFKRPIMNPGQNRGKIRQLVGQILMLYLKRREMCSVDTFVTIKSKALDDFYYQQIGLDLDGPNVQRFKSILNKLMSLFSHGGRPPLKAHDAIHLILLTDSLWDNYTPQWQNEIPQAFDKFADNIREVQRNGYTGDVDFVAYAIRIRTSADAAETISRRHGIYVRKMREYLGEALVPKDPQRGFLPLDRETIYFRDQKTCLHCNESVAWEDAEFHHVIPHAEGGETKIENGALLHKSCHRSMRHSDIQRLREKFEDANRE